MIYSNLFSFKAVHQCYIGKTTMILQIHPLMSITIYFCITNDVVTSVSDSVV